MNRIIIATKNKGKIKEFENLISDSSWEVVPLNELKNIPNIEETGTTFKENAFIKASTIANITSSVVIADDSGLEVDALNGAPGVYSARYGILDSEIGINIDSIDDLNNNKLLEALKDVSESKRTARFKCVIAIVFPDKNVFYAEGTCEGKIIDMKKGSNGFGYDPIFYIPELGCTMAELLMKEKNKISHRGKAYIKAKEILKCYLKK